MELMNIFGDTESKEYIEITTETECSEELSELFRFFKHKEIECLGNDGKDCSEIVEDYLEEFGGSALLILHNNHRFYDVIKFNNFTGSVEEYVYHYAFISNVGEIYDSMLGLVAPNLEEYLQMIKLKELNDSSTYTIEEIRNTKQLKSYI